MPDSAKRSHSAWLGSSKAPFRPLKGAEPGFLNCSSASSASARASSMVLRWIISVTSPTCRTTRCDGSNDTLSPS
ncbi:hypothetical protein D3C81_2284080 [compost metagenome]